MLRLMLCGLLLLSCYDQCSDFVAAKSLAQSTPPNTCYVTLDTTVPQFCYTSPLNKFPQGGLNFAIIENKSQLEFEPLPENRQVDLEVVDNSDGLKGWSSLANSFVDSVRSGSLPYDTILSYLNKTVDSPIASQCPSSNSQSTSTGTEDVDINSLLDDFRDWWTPIIVVTALGFVFSIIFATVGCFFCCYRLCGRCGGSLQQDYHEAMDARCFILYIILLCCVGLLFVGTVFAFVFNEKLNDSIQNFNGSVNTAIDNSLDFFKDIQIEVNLTVDRYNEVNAFTECEINNTHISVGGVVIDVFESTVGAPINSSLRLADLLNSSISALIQVNMTVGRLLTLTQRLEMELNNLTNQLAQLQDGCRDAAVSASVCDSIPTLSYTVTVNYSVVDDVSSVLDQLQQVGDIRTQALEANDTFYGIPCEIRDQIRNQTQENILNQTDTFRQFVFDITKIEREINNILNENGFVGDARAETSNIQKTLETYDTPRYIVSIVICLLMLLVIVVLIFGLILGACGFKREVYPQDRTPTSNCGGITLMVAVGMMFGLSVMQLLLSSFMFFLGENLLKVCYSIAEDPPNNQPSYEFYTKVVDNPELWGGYLLGCYVLDNSSVPLMVTDVLNGCRGNNALYQVAQLAVRPELNLADVTNFSSQVDDLLNSLQDEISFTADQILTEETRDSLRQYSSAGLQSIDYLGYTNQINATTSNLDVNGVITSMQMVHMEFDAANQSALVAQADMVIITTQRINDTTLVEIRNLTYVLEAQIIILNATASQLNQSVEAVLDAANRATTQLIENGTEIVLNQTRKVLNRIISYADNYVNWAVDNFKNKIGRCRPLYAAYNNVYYDVCEDTVDGINGFWLAMGWCVVLFIPTIIFAVWLSHYFRRMRMYRYPDLLYDPDELGGSGTYQRMREKSV